MPDFLKQSRTQLASGKYKAAIESLYAASPVALAGSGDQKRAVLDLATTIHDQADRRLQQDCDEICESMRTALDREFVDPAVADLRSQAMTSVVACRYLGGAGLPLRLDDGQLWSLLFTDGASCCSSTGARVLRRRLTSAGTVCRSRLAAPVRFARAAASSAAASALSVRLPVCSPPRRSTR